MELIFILSRAGLAYQRDTGRTALQYDGAVTYAQRRWEKPRGGGGKRDDRDRGRDRDRDRDHDRNRDKDRDRSRSRDRGDRPRDNRERSRDRGSTRDRGNNQGKDYHRHRSASPGHRPSSHYEKPSHGDSSSRRSESVSRIDERPATLHAAKPHVRDPSKEANRKRLDAKRVQLPPLPPAVRPVSPVGPPGGVRSGTDSISAGDPLQKGPPATQPLIDVVISPVFDSQAMAEPIPIVTTEGKAGATAHGVKPGPTAARVNHPSHRDPIARAPAGTVGPIRALIDTGASHDNYISKEVAGMLLEAGVKCTPCTSKICSGLGTSHEFCVDCSGIFKFKLSFFNDLLKIYETIVVSAKVAPIMEPIFIGAPTSREYSLPLRCFRAFLQEPISTALRPAEVLALVQEATFNSTPGWENVHPGHRQPAAGRIELPNLGMEVPLTSTARHSARVQDEMEGTVARRVFEMLPSQRIHQILEDWDSVSRIYQKSELLTQEPDSDYVFNEAEEPVYSSDDTPEKPEDILSLMTLEGSPKGLEDLKEIILEFSDCFSTKLRKEPARIPPMKLKVDDAAWKIPKHAGTNRPQSAPKEKEIVKQVGNLLDNSVIQPSTSAHYNQVHLTPKPHTSDSWRMCIDFRWLNVSTESIGQWKPNISQLIDLIEAAKPTMFEVLDLTSGYYQAPLHRDSWAYTAFRCCVGIYEWMRVPMGLKRAPAYF